MKRAAIVVISLVLGTLIAWTTVPRIETTVLILTPPTRWFEIGEIHVADARAGESPLMRVERIIRRPVTADWTAALRREEASGYVTVCTRHGVSNLLPDLALPSELTLDWWTAIPPAEPCPPLEPGRYRLDQVWLLHIPGIHGKEYRISSNIFEVRS